MAQVGSEPGQIMPTIPPVSAIVNRRSRRWRKVRACGSAAAYRRHLRQLKAEGIPEGERYKHIDEACLSWHRQHWNDKGPYVNVCACEGECVCSEVPGQVVVKKS